MHKEGTTDIEVSRGKTVMTRRRGKFEQPGNELKGHNKQRIRMNIGAFLHSRKQHKEQQLPLPLAPSYILPQHQWYFSSPTLVPLRKKKQNSSPLTYFNLQESTLQDCDDRSTWCVYQQHGYVQTQLRHIFKAVWEECRSPRALRDKIKCQCQHVPEERTAAFNIGWEQLREGIKQFRNDKVFHRAELKDSNVNWFELARYMVNNHTGQPLYSQDYMHMFKMPDGNPSEHIFSIVYSSNYLVFNSSHLSINQHMKTKAVELAQLIHQQLQLAVWKTFQQLIEGSIDDISDYETFIKKAKTIMSVSSFRLWFYKKDSNNQIYAMMLTDVGFKGVECQLYKNVRFRKDQQKVYELPTLDFMEGETPQAKDYHLLMHKVKTASLHSPVNQLTATASLNRLKLLKMNEANSAKTLDLLPSQPSPSIKIAEPTETQCQCCKNLLMSHEIQNEVIAKHIDQIRHLRQFKVAKKQHEPYDFVKVCEECYEVYRKHQKNVSRESNKKKAISFFEYKHKRDASFVDKTGMNSSKEQRQIIFKNASKEMLRNRSYKNKAVSQLSTSKEHSVYRKEGTSIQRKEEGCKIRPAFNSLPAKNKSRKTKTTHTSNSQTVDMEYNRTRLIRAQHRLERVLTDYQGNKNDTYILEQPSRHKTARNKGRLPPKCHHLINRIIMSSQESQGTLQQVRSSHNEPKFAPLSHAIEQYQSLSRPSFKKLLYKNRRGYLKNSNANFEHRRKSIHSYEEEGIY